MPPSVPLPKLTDDFLKTVMPEADKRLELRDDKEPGLIFRVTENGVRTWSVRYRNAAGEQRRKSLGKFPTIGLSKARALARTAKGEVAVGVDPVAVAKEAKAEERRKRLHAFSGLGEAYFEAAAAGTHRGGPVAKPKRPSTIGEEKRIFETLVKPKFGDRGVATITRNEIKDFVALQGRKAASNGRHCRNIIRQMMAYAVREGVIEHNPALDIAVSMSKPRQRVLTDAELLAVWSAWDTSGALMGVALRMATVTLQRGGEVVGMRWDEIDRASKTWLIPAARMKGKRPHFVPLSDLALTLVDEAARLTEGNGSEYVFASPRVEDGQDAHLDRRAFSRAMARLVSDLKLSQASPHDLRRTGASIMTSERLGIPRFIVSQVLAHAGDTGGGAAVTAQHYDVNDYLREKRRALDAWAELVRQIIKEKTPPP
ncbi:tyrosine-type recombinase/integrase [Mesorhizobium sp. LjNodule214]|uniref:tyrosine-type recombinase/integrase n=1 Tax=Mesorhizobium sp. LjNodule214 TaxID=3342252 RepID=UPI003ED16927